MNRIIKVGMLMIVLLALTACGANDAAGADVDGAVQPDSVEVTGSGEGESQSRSRDELREDFADNALPPASQMLLGTFMLEDTEFAVDAELAPYLTPYWKLYRSLLESDTTAPEELEALIYEIQEVMDVDQVNYIASLELTQEDLMVYMNESGIMESLRPEGMEGEEGQRPGRPDGMPEGTGSGQGGGRGAAEGMDPELLATMQAEREAAGTGGGMGGSRMTVPLIDALIELLESKSN